MRYTLVALAAVLLTGMPAAGRGNPPDADAACRSAMAPYYAALLASARGDGQGTLRQVIVLKSRWAEVSAIRETDLPAWLRDAGSGQSLLTAVASRIDAARQHLPGDVTGSHAELESIRTLLRDARTRHAVRSMDDAVTDYHEALERLSSHIGGRNEITLTEGDFTTIAKDLELARSAWGAVESSPELATLPANWKDMMVATKSVLASLAESARRHDAAATQRGSETLRARYQDLLAALSHRQ